MLTLEKRKTRLRFETSIAVRGRAVCVEATPYTLVLREKGRRATLSVAWDAIYWLAAKIAAENKRRDRKGREGKGRD